MSIDSKLLRKRNGMKPIFRRKNVVLIAEPLSTFRPITEFDEAKLRLFIYCFPFTKPEDNVFMYSGNKYFFS